MRKPKQFVPIPFEYHQEIELTIDTLTNLGHGLGRYDNWVVMVPYTIPGEKIRARIYRNHKNYSEGDLIEVITPSPERVKPECPLFGECGGCQYQHMSYAEQLRWKTQQVKELLERGLAMELEIQPAMGSPKEYYYRSKITPHYPRPELGQSLPIGFLHTGSHRLVVDVPNCPIATEAINEALPGCRKMVRAGADRLKRGGTLFLRHTLGGVTTDSTEVVSEKVNGVTFQFRSGDFFQNNPFILPNLVDHVLAQAKAPGVTTLIDAYCGTGLFCLCASRSFEKCYGVEISESSVEWARHNATVNGLKNCKFMVGQAEAIFENVSVKPEATSVVIDPPRKGSDEVFIQQLIQLKPKRVVYVSCDPATQSRDLKLLISNGFKIIHIQPFDLFPQTRHIENVVTLESTGVEAVEAQN